MSSALLVELLARESNLGPGVKVGCESIPDEIHLSCETEHKRITMDQHQISVAGM